LYFFYRSVKEPGYASNLTERLSFYRKEFKEACWCHAVSLGEFRAARPIFKKLLLNGEKLLITTLTLSGKSAAQQEYHKEIKEGKVLIVYAPLEITFMFKRFLKNFQPRCCIILECDLWPVMITTTYKGQIPLIFAQAQYPEKGFIRDKKFPFLKASLIGKFDLILSKSERHKKRFEYFGAKNVLIMGDARFEQTVPSHQIVAASKLKKIAFMKYFTICFASIGKQEFTIISEIIRDLHEKYKDIFFILVPRHPSDFGKYKILFGDSSIKVVTRNQTVSFILHPNLEDEPEYISKELVNEMVNLANNLNILTPKKRIAKIRKINPSILIGSGILNDIKKDIVTSKINLLIVNTNLTPRQQKNLEDLLKIKVTDRTGIILEIFAKRAKTKEGKLQVDLGSKQGVKQKQIGLVNGIKIQNSMLNDSILIVHTDDVFDNHSTLLPLNDNVKLTNLNNKIVKFVE